MGRSARLRIEDVRQLLRVVGELHEQSRDVMLRRSFLTVRLAEIFRAKLSVCADARGFVFGRPNAFAGFTTAGYMDARESVVLDEYARGGHADDPFLAKALKFTGDLKTWRRGELLTDREWYGSDHYNNKRIPAGLDDFIHAGISIESATADAGIAVHRPPSDRPFTARERNMLTALASEITCLFPRGRRPEFYLPPYLQRTLNELVHGRSEKEVANRMGLSRHTVHGYAKELHRRFGVSSRAELLAHVLGRAVETDWPAPETNGPSGAG